VVLDDGTTAGRQAGHACRRQVWERRRAAPDIGRALTHSTILGCEGQASIQQKPAARVWQG
jgi:hypothetical protein